MYRSFPFIVLLLISVKLALSARIRWTEKDSDGREGDDDEFTCTSDDYRFGTHHKTFTYSKQDRVHGPSVWASLPDSEGEFCGAAVQSPINILFDATCAGSHAKPAVNLNTPDLKYHEEQYNFKFDCTANCGSLKYDNTTYEFKQIHFHMESEHQYDGLYKDMEAHFVHQHIDAATGIPQYAVLAVFIEKDDDNANDAFADLMTAASNRNTAVAVDLSKLYDDTKKTFAITGSFTTPKCNQGVQWLISQEVMTISEGQAADFYCKLGRKYNNRPLQEKGGRCLFVTA